MRYDPLPLDEDIEINSVEISRPEAPKRSNRNSIRKCIFTLVAVQSTCFCSIMLNFSLAVICILSWLSGIAVIVLFENQDASKYPQKLLLVARNPIFWILSGIFLILYVILCPFEIEAPSYTIDTTGMDFSSPFYQMYNPSLSYMESLETLDGVLNANSTVKQQRLPITVGDVWGSDPLRFRFLQLLWDHNANSPDAVDNNNTISPYACIVESDVLLNRTYIDSLLRKQIEGYDKEIFAIQHFWGHRTFESVNFGILCATRHDVSRTTKFYVALMHQLLTSRLRRLMYLNPLFNLIPASLIIGWDLHHGCTSYGPNCNYIHFTRPKNLGIDQALEQQNLKHNRSFR